MGRVVSPRVSDEVQAFYKGSFPTMTAGAEFALEAFRVLYRDTLALLVGRFTVRELSLMIDVSRVLDLTPQTAGQTLPARCADAILLDLYDRKWKVDRDQISKKMLRLNRWETLCLELWARSFWLTGTAGELEAFEQYAEPLAQRA
jgi:hypothetical protein